MSAVTWAGRGPAIVIAAADRLEDAERRGRPIAPLRDGIGADDLATAYAIQAELTRRRIGRGGRAVGRKVGLTSAAVQRQLGVDQPDFGVLFADMRIPDAGVVRVDRLIQPRIEAEVAFELGADLDGRLDATTIRAAVRAVAPALEIVDSRISDWDIGIVDTVADNGSSARFVLGAARAGLHEVEPREVAMTLRVDGEVVSTGTGAACLGDPLEALAWLAATARRAGAPLLAGDIVLSGALGPMVPLVAGTVVEAEVAPLGGVSVRCVDGEAR